MPFTCAVCIKLALAQKSFGHVEFGFAAGVGFARDFEAKLIELKLEWPTDERDERGLHLPVSKPQRRS